MERWIDGDVRQRLSMTHPVTSTLDRRVISHHKLAECHIIHTALVSVFKLRVVVHIKITCNFSILFDGLCNTFITLTFKI